jgi:DNA-binding response OmpR family regulator
MHAESGGARETEVSIFEAGDLTIDLGRQRVTRDGQEIPLPKLSFDLLLALVRAAPNIATLDSIH